jgi:hypothetical protein
MLISFGFAALLGVASLAEGAQVYTPPATGHLARADGLTTASAWPGNTLYVNGGTTETRVAVRADKHVAQLNIADIAEKQADFATVEIVRLEAAGDPLIGESLLKMTFGAPPNSPPGEKLMAIAWLFAIGLIGIATVGRRRNKL